MKNSIRFFVVSGLLILIGCYSCGAPNSDVEKQAAQEAMDKAKNLHAESIAASNWTEAVIAWEQGQAAVKEGKSAKTYFIKARSRFEKAAAIAKSTGDVMASDVAQIQGSIDLQLSRIKADLEKGRLSAKIQKQIKPMIEEADQGVATLAEIVRDGDFMKAKKLAKEIQSKVLNAQLIAAGKKPIY